MQLLLTNAIQAATKRAEPQVMLTIACHAPDIADTVVLRRWQCHWPQGHCTITKHMQATVSGNQQLAGVVVVDVRNPIIAKASGIIFFVRDVIDVQRIHVQQIQAVAGAKPGIALFITGDRVD